MLAPCARSRSSPPPSRPSSWRRSRRRARGPTPGAALGARGGGGHRGVRAVARAHPAAGPGLAREPRLRRPRRDHDLRAGPGHAPAPGAERPAVDPGGAGGRPRRAGPARPGALVRHGQRREPRAGRHDRPTRRAHGPAHHLGPRPDLAQRAGLPAQRRRDRQPRRGDGHRAGACWPGTRAIPRSTGRGSTTRTGSRWLPAAGGSTWPAPSARTARSRLSAWPTRAGRASPGGSAPCAAGRPHVRSPRRPLRRRIRQWRDPPAGPAHAPVLRDRERPGAPTSARFGGPGRNPRHLYVTDSGGHLSELVSAPRHAPLGARGGAAGRLVAGGRRGTARRRPARRRRRAGRSRRPPRGPAPRRSPGRPRAAGGDGRTRPAERPRPAGTRADTPDGAHMVVAAARAVERACPHRTTCMCMQCLRMHGLPARLGRP